jgi:ABC-type branched-subunit amino acid transport system ATPase component
MFNLRLIFIKIFLLFEKADRRKIYLITIVQVLSNFLDLMGVALLGVLGSLAITGSASKNPGSRVQGVLEFLNINDMSVQNQAIFLGTLAGIFLITKTLFSLFFAKRTMYFLSYRSAKLTENLIAKLLSQSLQSINKNSVQENIYALTGGIGSVVNSIIGASIFTISDLSLTIIMLCGLFYIDPLICLLTIILYAGIAAILYLLLNKRVQSLGVNQARMSIKNQEMIREILGTYREAVVGAKRSYYIQEVRKHQFDIAKNNAEFSFFPNISKYALEITLIIGVFLISAVQFYKHSAEHTVAVLAIFLVSSARIAPAILRMQQSLIQMRGSIGMAAPALKLINELQDIEVPVPTTNKFTTDHKNLRSDIVLKNVNFNYTKNHKFNISNCNLLIEAGTISAIVGRSGAGKTTLVDILLGVLIPTTGEVFVAGKPPGETINNYPGSLAYVPQDVFIINGTIRENVCLGYNKEDIPTELVYKALEKAQLTEFVENLPNKIDTHIGDNGSRLSGGQRQRLGIARALITEPIILVMDESTSSLDGETENNLTNAIISLKGDTTLILIAHRLSTIRNADKIIYMEDGKIITSGTFSAVRASVPDFDKQSKLMGL